MKKHQKQNWRARKALFADASHEVIPVAVSGALLTAEGSLKKLRRVPAVKLFTVVAFLTGLLLPGAEARFLFFGEKKSAREKIVERKIKRLNHKNPNERILAAKDLARMEGKKASRHLLERLSREDSPGARADFSEILGNLRDKDAADGLIQLIKKEKNPNIRQIEVLALGQTGNPAAIGELEEIFLDKKEDMGVRLQAGNGLTYIKDRGIFDIFKTALKFNEPDIQKQALLGIHRTDFPDDEKIKIFKDMADSASTASGFAMELIEMYGRKTK